jgi:hypothetical protein
MGSESRCSRLNAASAGESTARVSLAVPRETVCRIPASSLTGVAPKSPGRSPGRSLSVPMLLDLPGHHLLKSTRILGNGPSKASSPFHVKQAPPDL